jgi:large subunit ribosomal protein L10
MVSLKKHQIRERIIDFFNTYQNFVLIKFGKTKHSSLEDLRKQLRKSGAKIRVVKNSIFSKALTQMSLKNKEIKAVQKKVFPIRDSTAILGLSEKWNEGLNAFYQFIQKEKTLSLNIGCLEKVIYQNNQLLTIAQLPSKELLIGKIISTFKSPISRLIYAFKFNGNKIVHILRGVRPSEALAEGGEKNG